MARASSGSTNPKIMEMVERELARNPDISVDDLFAKAKKIDRSVGKLSNRQFHARYPLQVKRRKSRSSKSKAKPKAKTQAKRTRRTTRKRATSRSAPSAPTANAADREAVRTTFLSFASDLAAAEARKDVVKVLAGVDKYVDQAIKAASG